ncbi:hypothetical protein H4582DRAFT_1977670 [Lactarius indigo]|nr:hypothetical protein H4582DRAFT_2019508 [Lactarius indigo]KAI9434467.1 hypothetical protein H4582DRAFT_1977670 [Lactarius indigo]
MSSLSPEDQQQRLYGPHILFNTNAIYNAKFISSCFTGAVAGIIGLENWLGFFLFLFTTLFTSLVLHFVNLKASPKKYVQGGFLEVVNPGQENTFSFILVWTLFYAMVHVYD